MDKRTSTRIAFIALALFSVAGIALASAGPKKVPEKPEEPILVGKWTNPEPTRIEAEKKPAPKQKEPTHIRIVVEEEEEKTPAESSPKKEKTPAAVVIPVQTPATVVVPVQAPEAVLPVVPGMTPVSEVLAPVKAVQDIGYKAPKGIEWISSGDAAWSLKGSMSNQSATVILLPQDRDAWDFSDYSYVRIDMVNTGPSLVWIRGRLDNSGAEDWANSSPSSVFIMPGERATLGFAYPRSEEANDAPAIFGKQNGKPNGHRTHWKPFDPANVRACRLEIESNSKTISLEQITVSAAQPYGMAANAALLELPYLDSFGQVQKLNWPGKLLKEEELIRRLEAEQKTLASNQGPTSFNQYGGWRHGPQLNATGFFRTEKFNGKWWLVDPSGRLFFSHGANSVWFEHSTPLEGREALFEWLPYGDPMQADVLKNGKCYFQIANLIRTFGSNWKPPAHERIHRRLRSWGMNTLGAWSMSDLVDDRKTAYTSILHIGWDSCVLGKKLADPFSQEFKGYLRNGLHKIRATQGEDPWCIGVFIDNEIEWHRDMVKRAFEASPQQPARQAVIAWLQRKYPTLNQVNAAWGSQFTSWQHIRPMEGKGTPVRTKDLESLSALIAEKYYSECRNAMREVLPNHLYLGSRIHSAPVEVLKESAKYTDVVSLNNYGHLAGIGNLPKGTDKPIMNSEFHFGAPDRGLPGVGLWPVGDQVQRSRAYVAYVTAGLLNPNIVGTHWFAYSDQSAAGRPGENFQIGFVDVTDTPYPLITGASREMADRMYNLRATGKTGLLETLESFWKKDSQLGSEE